MKPLGDYHEVKLNGWHKEYRNGTLIGLGIVCAISLVLMIGLVSANLGSFKQNECVQIVTVLNSSSVNISGITSPTPNPEIIVTNVVMTKNGNFFNYSFCNTSKLGTYTYGYTDSIGNVYSNSFDITGNGNPRATSGVIVLFAIIFLLLLLFGAYLILYSFGHIVTLDFDILDVALNFGIFFAFLGGIFLEQEYLGNPSIEQFITPFLFTSGIVFIFIPLIGFIVSIIVGGKARDRMGGRGLFNG